MNKGFTLIEILLYIALYSLLVATVTVAAFDLIQSSQKAKAKIADLRSVHHLFSRIQFLLNSRVEILSPVLYGESDILMVRRDGKEIEITGESLGAEEFRVMHETVKNAPVIHVVFTLHGRQATSTYFLLP